MYLSIARSIYLSICKLELKTKLFCETFSFFEVENIKIEAILRDFFIFELDNIQNEAILRDFFNFWTWQHQKQSNSARPPSKMESWVQSWQPRTNAFCDFSSPPVGSTAPARKKWCQVIRSAAPVTRNHLSKPEDLMLQNATLSGNQRPDFRTAPMKMSLVLRLPRKMHLCRPSSNVPRLPSFLAMLQNPHVLLTLEKVHNPLRLPRETRSELPKVVRTWCVLYILTSRCTSRHNGVHFFDISTSKSGPNLVCFVHIDFEMCFAPQRRALFRHRNFQKWSEPGVFCTFWLGNVLRATATTACNFSSLIWPDGSARAALASLLFDPPEPQIIGETLCFATFLPFRASASSFFRLFIFSDLLSSTLLFSLPLPISAFHLSILSEVWLLNFLRLVTNSPTVTLPKVYGLGTTNNHFEKGS